MNGRKSQRKGRSGETELCDTLGRFGYNARPGRARSFGSEPDITGLPGIHVEVKRVEKLNIEEALRQAEGDAIKFEDGLPCVFHRRNRTQWVVSMRLRDWLTLYGKSQE